MNIHNIYSKQLFNSFQWETQRKSFQSGILGKYPNTLAISEVHICQHYLWIENQNRWTCVKQSFALCFWIFPSAVKYNALKMYLCEMCMLSSAAPGCPRTPHPPTHPPCPLIQHPVPNSEFASPPFTLRPPPTGHFTPYAGTGQRLHPSSRLVPSRLPKLMTIAFKETEMLVCLFRLFVCLFLARSMHTLHPNGPRAVETVMETGENLVHSQHTYVA